jgi:hypothetical protein
VLGPAGRSVAQLQAGLTRLDKLLRGVLRRRRTTLPPGVLVPLLTLGLPTSATAAVLIAPFQQYGLQPGPLLFEQQPELVWGLVASLFIGNAMRLVINLPLAPAWTRLLQVPRPLLYAGIVLFAALARAGHLRRRLLDAGVQPDRGRAVRRRGNGRPWSRGREHRLPPSPPSPW